MRMQFKKFRFVLTIITLILGFAACNKTEKTNKDTKVTLEGQAALEALNKAAKTSTKHKNTDTQAASQPASQPASQSSKKTELGRGETPALRNQIDTDGVVRRGKKLSSSLESITTEQCFKNAEKLNGKTVKLSGIATQVCSKKGCWWILSGEHSDQQIRIGAKDYAFFLPEDIKGKQAIVEGKLEVKTLTQEEIDHLIKDSGDPKTIIAKNEIRIAAVAIEMKSLKR